MPPAPPTCMLKPHLILRRNFSLFNRVPPARIVQLAARDGHESFAVQRFRIHKPFFTRSRMLGAFVFAALYFGVSRYVRIEIEIEDENGRKSLRPAGAEGEDEEEDEEYDDSLLFLPTGFSRAKPKTFYRGSDPEWQEFRKLATDKPRVNKIRKELTALIRTTVKKNPSFAARLGNIDTEKGNSWVEVQFPDGPPIEFEQPGIELTEDLEWRKAMRPVEELHHKRIARLLWPTWMSSALYEDVKRRAGATWNSFRTSIGLEAKSEPETVQVMIQRVGADLPPPPSAPSAAPAAPGIPTSAAADTKQPADATNPPDSAAKYLGFAFPDPRTLTMDMTQFRQDIRKTFKPYAIQPPRGCFAVLGLIEVHGDKGRATLNVRADYDPKQGRYVSLQAAIWNLKDNRQRPKGGP